MPLIDEDVIPAEMSGNCSLAGTDATNRIRQAYDPRVGWQLDPELRKITSDPVPRVDGIDSASDSLTAVRSAIYPLGGRRRLAAVQNDRPESPVTDRELHHARRLR